MLANCNSPATAVDRIRTGVPSAIVKISDLCIGDVAGIQAVILDQSRKPWLGNLHYNVTLRRGNRSFVLQIQSRAVNLNTATGHGISSAFSGNRCMCPPFV